ncbi:MAG: hypothetical protein ABI461_17860 [Polyangiaceae bacterium]
MARPDTAPEFPLHALAREDAEEIDPELIALPAPPKAERTWTVVLLAVTIAASLGMMTTLFRDAEYAFAPHAVVDLGDLNAGGASSKLDGLLDNRYVHANAMLGAAGAIRYERAFDSDSYRVAPVAGRNDVWVEIRVPEGQESSRFVPPNVFAGRLVRFSEVGPRHRGVQNAIAAVGGAAVAQDGWLLVDGEPPMAARWALSLIALFAAFALWNSVAIWRLVRRVE